MKFLKVAASGNIDVVISCNTFDAVPPGFLAFETEEDDLVLIELRYIKEGEIKVRSARPSESHIWNLASENWVLDLSRLRESKSRIIDQACKLAIVSGFVSYALGDPHHYPSKVTDQQNLAAAVLASYYPGLALEWTAACYCSDDAGQWSLVQHAAAQIRQVQIDANLAIETYRLKNAQLQAQIANAETVDQIELVAW